MVLVLGGEAATAENVRRWSTKLQLINSYGPAECTIWSNANASITPATDPANFGPAFASAIWVAEMNNPEVLLPVGAVGELLIQGPLVARGYIADAEKTAKAFIPRPSWAPASAGDRMYRSGDIVRYNPNGTLSFVRRRDNQVKVRGQRVELNEIEVHLSRASEDVQHVIALLPKAGVCQGRLTTVLSYRSKTPNTSERGLKAMNSKEITTRNAEIKEYLNTKLPGYMVPKLWIPVEKIPLLTHGKIDRRQVSTWVEKLTQEDLANIVGQGTNSGNGRRWFLQ